MNRLALTLAVAGCAAAIAGCGSSAPSTGSSGAGSDPSSSANARFQDAVKFSQCMRQHGVPTFPDPGPGGDLQIGQASGIVKGSPALQSAQQACRSLLPNGGRPTPLSPARQQAMLQFSQCMRAHGVTNFPDPQFGTGGGAEIRIGGPGSGLAPNSPVFQSAQRACATTLRKALGGAGVFKTQGP